MHPNTRKNLINKILSLIELGEIKPARQTVLEYLSKFDRMSDEELTEELRLTSEKAERREEIRFRRRQHLVPSLR